MSEIDAVIDRLVEARAAIFAHVGYVENWRVLPIDDSRDQFWAVDKYEREWVKFSPSREALAYWLADHDDEYGSYGDVLYENVIYTQRHLPKWVYRGAELTLVVADTQTDGNKYLQLFRNENEVLSNKAQRLRMLHAIPRGSHPLNVAIDQMIDGDRKSPAADLLAKVRSMCAAIPLADLRTAIEVHQANCRQAHCPVLAAMLASAEARSTASALRTCPGCGRRFALLYICERCGQCDAKDLPRDANRDPCCKSANDSCVERDWRAEAQVSREVAP